MQVRSLRQLNFRNLATERLRFEDGVTAVVGPNAAGKSNLLAAVALGASGALPSGTIGEALRFGTSEGYLRLELTTAEGPRTVEVALAPGRKVLRLDGQAVRAAELARVGGVVRVTPEDADLVHGAPAGRRAFLDDLLARLSLRYASLLRAYQRVLEQRNAALKAHAGGGALAVWDERFVALGAEIQGLRRRAVASLAARATAAYDEVAGEHGAGFDVALVPSHPSDDLEAALAATRAEEQDRGATLVGPHRDDLLLTLAGRRLQAFGSRGEARTAALSLRVAEFAMLQERHGVPPVLLLDDVHAELDASRRAYLADLAARTPQAIVSSTESPTRFDRLWRIDRGRVDVDAAPGAAGLAASRSGGA